MPLSIMLFMLNNAELIRSVISWAVVHVLWILLSPLATSLVIFSTWSVTVSAIDFKSETASGTLITASCTESPVSAKPFISDEISIKDPVVSLTEFPIQSIAFRVSSAVPLALFKVSTMLLSVLDASVAFKAVASESFLISPATTAKPKPAFPAWAASIAAFIAKRFVWALTSLIAAIISLTASMFSFKLSMTCNKSFTLFVPFPTASVKSAVIEILSETIFATWLTELVICVTETLAFSAESSSISRQVLIFSSCCWTDSRASRIDFIVWEKSSNWSSCSKFFEITFDAPTIRVCICVAILSTSLTRLSISSFEKMRPLCIWFWTSDSSLLFLNENICPPLDTVYM